MSVSVTNRGAKEVEYRDIDGFPGYRVGDDGTVWSRRCRRPVPGRGSEAHLSDTWHQLRPWTDPHGYLGVGIYADTKTKVSIRIHRLVLLAFVGPCQDGMEACHHPDPTRSNCRLDNLRWDTKKNNVADQLKHGTRVRGIRQGSAKLTDDAVREIRRRLATGEYQHRIAKDFGVTRAAISDIKFKRTWRHV